MHELPEFSELHLKLHHSGDWMLSQPFFYFRRGLVIPPGFRTDLDSVPRLPIVYAAFKGRTVRAAVIHDWLYETRAGKSYADRVFLDAMRDEGIPAHCRYPIYWAVVLFGGPIYADRGA